MLDNPGSLVEDLAAVIAVSFDRSSDPEHRHGLRTKNCEKNEPTDNMGSGRPYVKPSSRNPGIVHVGMLQVFRQLASAIDSVHTEVRS
jgi:hypothetical protein